MNLQVGIIGLGNIGHRFGISATGDPLSHSEAYAQLSGVTVTLGIDPDPEARTAFKKRFPESKIYPDLIEIPDSIRLDLVSVCSPTHLHLQGVTAALSWQPRVILCEKPLAPTVAEAKQIIAACAARNCILMANYSRRWTPMLEILKQLTGPGGRLGTPIRACLRYDGGLRHNGTHWIDLLQALLGPVQQAVRLESPSLSHPDPSDSISMHWQNGFAAYLIAVGSLDYSIAEGEIWGTAGMFRYSDSGQKLVFQSVCASQWEGFQELSPPETLCALGLEGHLLAAVREAQQLAQFGGQPSCSGVDGLLALQVVEQVRSP
jgi:UDP-N-acetyl-2-amino-2-deoxyglucuronate dehydrogenase